MLDKDTFKTVVKSTPLISIDLVVRSKNGTVLLGKRTNRPAKGFWFVPGGRILKGEKLTDAFRRLSLAELGVEISIDQAKYLGLYEHFYNDSALCEFTSTHYVVTAFVINLNNDLIELPQDQHSEYKWLSEKELLRDEQVHDHSKWYFMNEKGYLA
ncbi:MAG: GDP-mannose mannosyl hydrolase [Neptuniibacter sp. Phe_28]|nr:MAG: GDP-mannose mannosyl hydrolase [Neptuniibacter sp. Phe_28]